MTLHVAIKLAERGFNVFPIRAGEKLPAFKGWQEWATSDPDAVFQKWPADRPDYNVGVLTTGLVVLDADKGKGGVESLLRLFESGQLPRTLVVRTASGGRHAIYRAPPGVEFANRVSRTRKDGTVVEVIAGAPGIDIRAKGGLIVGAGSSVNGVTYEIDVDVPIAEIPPEIAASLLAAPERADDASKALVELDTPLAIDLAKHFIADHGAKYSAVPGGRGSATYEIAAELGDLGIGCDMALEMLGPWNNEHCHPAQTDDEFELCVRHAYEFRTSPLGCKHPLRPFDVIAAPPGLTPATGGSGLVVRRASEIVPTRLEWLWPGRIPRGKLKLLAGLGKMGKSTVLAGITAIITQGGEWPNGEGRAPVGSVVILSAEDDPEDTIIPRLMAAGANLDKVHIVDAARRDDGKGERTFNIEADAAALEKLIVEIGDVALVILDPISSYFGKSDTYRNTEVRSALEPLIRVANNRRISVIGNTHLGKSEKANANFRILDSVAMVNAVRAVSLVVADPEDPNNRRLWIPTAGNLTAAGRPGLTFTISEHVVVPDQEITGTRVDWLPGEVTMTAEQALAGGEKRGRATPALDQAKEFLRLFLADGPKTADEIEEGRKGNLLSTDSVRNAARELKIEKNKSEGTMGGPWIWKLPVAVTSGADW